MFRLGAWTFCLMIIIGQSQAQECVDIAKVMAVNIVQSQNSDQQQAITQSQLCTADYSSASESEKASINASYELFSGGASASDDKIESMQSSRCEGHYGLYWSSRVSSLNASTISSLGASVVQACFEHRSFKLSGLATNSAALTATFVNANTSPVTISVASVQPSEAATCTAGLNGSNTPLTAVQGKKLLQNETLTLSCVRTPQKVPGESDRQHFLGGLITVATNTDAATVPLFDYYQPAINHDEADSFEKTLSSLKDTQSTDEAAVNNLKTSLDGVKAESRMSIIKPPIQNGTKSCSEWCSVSGAQACVGALVTAGPRNGQWINCGDVGDFVSGTTGGVSHEQCSCLTTN